MDGYVEKHVNNIDKELWRKFVGKCYSENILVGHKINHLIDKELKRIKRHKNDEPRIF